MLNKDDFAERAIALRSRQYRVAWAILQNEADCADAMQEALTKAWAARQTLRDTSLFSTWLIRILINECRTILRKRRRHVLVAEPRAGAKACDAYPEIQLLIDALPEKLRLPFVLHHIEAYSIKETAEMLAVTASTVKNRVFRARNALKKELENNEIKEARAHETI